MELLGNTGYQYCTLCCFYRKRAEAVDIYQTSLQHRRLVSEMLSGWTENLYFANAGLNPLNSLPSEVVEANTLRKLEREYIMKNSHCSLVRI